MLIDTIFVYLSVTSVKCYSNAGSIGTCSSNGIKSIPLHIYIKKSRIVDSKDFWKFLLKKVTNNGSVAFFTLTKRNPGLSYFEWRSLATAHLLANLHFAFRQSKVLVK